LLSIEAAVQGVKNGEAELYEVIVKSFQQQLFHYCYHMLGNVQEAEDAVQDAFLKAFEKIGTYGSSVSFSAWLYKITYHHCINIIRRKRLISFIPFIDEAGMGAAGIETALEENELGRALAKALKKLPPADKSVLLLRTLEEKTFEEISVILGVKPAAARKKYERGKKKLKATLTCTEGGFVNEGYSIGR
jgi:RNA polymerase sigma-70 factor (ECF subfamily)